MRYKPREAAVFSCTGETKQDALNGALDVINFSKVLTDALASIYQQAN